MPFFGAQKNVLAYLTLVMSCGFYGFEAREDKYGGISNSTIRSWGVPEDAHILIESQETCEHAPTQFRASLALMCEFSQRLKTCTSAAKQGALIEGMNCSGKFCHLDIDAPCSACFLKHYGVMIDANNPKRAAACGLDATDADWLTPSMIPIGPAVHGNEVCAMAQVDGVQTHVWVQCVGGNPIVRMRLDFERDMPANYNCLVNPTCDGGKQFISQFLCYTVATPEVEASGVEVNGKVDVGTSEMENGSVQNALIWTHLAVVLAAYLTRVF